MVDSLTSKTTEPSLRQIARAFRLLGWAGFWLQTLLGFIPIFVVVSSVLFSPIQAQRIGTSWGMSLAIACLILLLFSIYWCFRYTRLANKLEHRGLRPTKATVNRDLRLGLLINLSSMTLAVFFALARVGELTMRLLTLPQGSTVISPNQTAGTVIAQSTVVTASNMIAIQSMLHVIAAGLVGAIVAVSLLYQVGLHRRQP